MGVLLDKNTRVMIQGFDGAGQCDARNCRVCHGTQVASGWRHSEPRRPGYRGRADPPP